MRLPSRCKNNIRFENQMHYLDQGLLSWKIRERVCQNLGKVSLDYQQTIFLTNEQNKQKILIIRVKIPAELPQQSQKT